MNNDQLINQDSGEFEYFTPIEIVNAAREVMGSIDLDPFSSSTANMEIKADLFFDMDGLDHNWHGNIWMNHPFSRKMNKPCIEKLIFQYGKYNIEQACCITYASTSEKWFQPLLDFPQCYLSPRTNYFLPDGSLKR